MFYVVDENGNRKEAYTKEEVMAVIQQVIDDGSLSGVDAQSAFISKLKCCVSGDTYPISFVTQAKYNELKQNNQLVKNQLYFITDDTTEEVLEQNIDGLWEKIEFVDEYIISKKKLLFSSDEGVTSHVFENISVKGKTYEVLVGTAYGKEFYKFTVGDYGNGGLDKVRNIEQIDGLGIGAIRESVLVSGSTTTGKATFSTIKYFINLTTVEFVERTANNIYKIYEIIE